VGSRRPKGRVTLERLRTEEVRFTLEKFKCYKVYTRKDGSQWRCACLDDADVWHGPVVYAHDTRADAGGPLDRWNPGGGAPLGRWYCSGWEWQEVLDAVTAGDPLERAIAARVLGRRRKARKVGE
jgi:hypothetical protein